MPNIQQTHTASNFKKESIKYFQDYSLYQKFMQLEYIPKMRVLSQQVGYAAQFILAKIEIIESSPESLAKKILEIGIKAFEKRDQINIEMWRQKYWSNNLTRYDLVEYSIQNLNYQEFKVDPGDLRIALKLMLHKKELMPEIKEGTDDKELESVYKTAWRLANNIDFFQLHVPEILKIKNEENNWSLVSQPFKMFRAIFK
ncbi:MAG: hypothetical protein OHK0017_04490 [Patescibacteria group bacterium]